MLVPPSLPSAMDTSRHVPERTCYTICTWAVVAAPQGLHDATSPGLGFAWSLLWPGFAAAGEGGSDVVCVSRNHVAKPWPHVSPCSSRPRL